MKRNIEASNSHGQNQKKDENMDMFHNVETHMIET